MSPQPSRLPQHRSTNITPQIQQAMSEHLDKTLPANLQYYQKSGAYVPPNIQKQMTEHMQQSMPEHLKQYINPYMQQQIVPQHLAPPPGAGQPAHFNVRHTALNLTPGQQVQPTVGGQQMPPQPQQVAQPQVVAPTQEAPYAFITDPAKPPRPAPPILSMLKGGSLMTRVAMLGGGLVVLLILFNIIGGLFATSFKLQPFIAVIQDQQELIHLTTNTTNQTALPAPYQNFVATTQLTTSSAQGQLVAYLLHNKQKIKPQAFNVKVSPTIDTELTNALASNTLTSTFQQVMSSQLTAYTNDIHTAYTETSGKKGHTQLSSDYSQALLLIKQLNQANTASGS